MRIIGVLFPMLTTFGFAQSCEAACSNEIINKVQSPTGSYTAAIFERNCGATSGNNFQVSIFRSDAALGELGNTFVIDYSADQYPDVPLQAVVKLHWTSQSDVTIEYKRGARIFTQAIMIEGVKVRYVDQ
jgi:hypothetical protein